MKNFNILLIDDNPVDADLSQKMFHLGGIPKNLNHLDSAQKALNYLQKLPPYEKTSTPHLIFLDIDMPVMNGKELLKKIKSDPRFQYIPIIMLTSSDLSQDVRKCYDLFANAYLKKPTTHEAMLKTIQSIESFWFDLAELP